MNASLVDWINDLNFHQLADSFGSPSWIVHEGQIIENVSKFEIFTGASNWIYFPVKTNPSLSVLQIFAKLELMAHGNFTSKFGIPIVEVEKTSFNLDYRSMII